MLLESDQAIALFKSTANGIAKAGKVLLVSGEAGIGKTALLEHMRERIGPQVKTLWSGCEPLFTPRPYAPLHYIADFLSRELLPLLESSASPSKLFSAFTMLSNNCTPPLFSLFSLFSLLKMFIGQTTQR